MLNCAISKTQGPLSPHSWGTRGKHEHAASSSEETVDDADGRTCIYHTTNGLFAIYYTTEKHRAWIIFHIPYYHILHTILRNCDVPHV